jgi:hypothetical protein
MSDGYNAVIDEEDGLNPKPFQIDLLSASVHKNPKFSTLLTLYDQVPHYSVEHSLTGNNARSTQFQVANSVWFLENSPAVVMLDAKKDEEAETISRFAGKREELIMAGLIKLATANPVMSGDKLGVPFYLRELQRIISVGGKTRYSLTEIKLALRILKNSNYRLKNYSEDGAKQSWEYSQISELLSSSYGKGSDDRYFVVFNRLLTEQILNLQTRLYNFDRFKELHRSLSRPLYVRLCIRFVQASDDTTYTIKISTLRQLGGLASNEAMAIDKRRLPVINAFKELIKSGVLKSYKKVKGIQIRPESSTNNRKKTIDEVYELTAAPAFIAEQKKASAVRNEEAAKMEIANSKEGELTTQDRNSILNLPLALSTKVIQDK